MVNAKINYLSSYSRLNKIWNFSIGTCHAYTLLRSDVRQQLKLAHQECGFKYVRCHGIFMDQMHVVSKDHNNNLEYSFFNIDNIYDYLLEIGMKPFVEISFMPEVLASAKSYVFRYKGNISTPKNYDEWDNFIKAFIKHLISRYGVNEVRSWYFEVWNEPNLGGDIANYNTGFFFGNQKDYFKLYSHTVRAIKEVDNKLQVGGPATSNNQWIPEFVNYCKSNDVPCDFISTHHYPSDVIFGDNCQGGIEFKRLQEDLDKSKDKALAWAEFEKFKSKLWKYIPKFTPIEMSRKARSEAGGYPLYYTEQSSLAGLASDGEFGASYVMEINLRNMDNVNGYSYWCLSDIFEESFQHSKEFNGGFGIFTYHGVKKAVYHAFSLLNKLDGDLNRDIFEKDSLTIRLIKGDTKDHLVITNYDSLDKKLNTYEGNVIIENYNCNVKNITTYMIDETHSNPLKIYQDSNYQSDYLSKDEINDLKNKSKLYTNEKQIYHLSNNTLSIPYTIKGQAIVMMEINK